MNTKCPNCDNYYFYLKEVRFTEMEYLEGRYKVYCKTCDWVMGYLQ
jgi:RNase P subunit RPR2